MCRESLRTRQEAVHRLPPSPPTCLNLISHRQDVVERGRDAALAAARDLADLLT